MLLIRNEFHSDIEETVIRSPLLGLNITEHLTDKKIYLHSYILFGFIFKKWG